MFVELMCLMCCTICTIFFAYDGAVMSAFVSLRRMSNNVSTFQRGYLGFISLFDIPTGILEKGCIQTCSEHQMNFDRVKLHVLIILVVVEMQQMRSCTADSCVIF